MELLKGVEHLNLLCGVKKRVELKTIIEAQKRREMGNLKLNENGQRRGEDSAEREEE